MKYLVWQRHVCEGIDGSRSPRDGDGAGGRPASRSACEQVLSCAHASLMRKIKLVSGDDMIVTTPAAGTRGRRGGPLLAPAGGGVARQ